MVNKNLKLWVWTDVNRSLEAEGLKNRFRTMKDRGLTGMFCGGGYDKANFDSAKEAGLEVHCWMWTTNRGDAWIRENHPEWYMVSRSGKSCFDNPPYVDYYRWISPGIPEAREYICANAEEFASHENVDGVHLDYVRYPDVILPRGLWETYGLDQSEELADYDFCYSPKTQEAFKAATGRDLMTIEDPAHDQEWLHFRYGSVTQLVNEVKVAVQREGKQLTAAVFPTPSMARRICRQSWDKWPLDAVCPMVYHSFYNQTIDWIGDCLIENIQSVRIPIYAGLYMPALENVETFVAALDVCAKRGASGVSLFGSVSDAHWKALEDWRER